MPTATAVLGDVVEIARNILSGASSNRVPIQGFQKTGQGIIPIKSINEIKIKCQSASLQVDHSPSHLC